jgi:hypothetical protein
VEGSGAREEIIGHIAIFDFRFLIFDRGNVPANCNR